MAEHDHARIAGIAAFGDAPGAAIIGEHERAADIGDPGAQLRALPPAVEQGGDAACHQHAHIGDDPVGRIARGNADAVALGDAVARDQRGSDACALRHSSGQRSAGYRHRQGIPHRRAACRNRQRNATAQAGPTRSSAVSGRTSRNASPAACRLRRSAPGWLHPSSGPARLPSKSLLFRLSPSALMAYFVIWPYGQENPWGKALILPFRRSPPISHSIAAAAANVRADPLRGAGAVAGRAQHRLRSSSSGTAWPICSASCWAIGTWARCSSSPARRWRSAMPTT